MQLAPSGQLLEDRTTTFQERNDMATDQLRGVLHRLRGAARRADAAGVPAGALLEAYVAHRDEAAFEALVRQHGPMVLNTCRRILSNAHDAEDAFQATFLVLVRKAATIQPRHRVAHWLYGVAWRTARKARALAARRQARD